MPSPSQSRDLRLDFFRGVSLILIFIDHIPENVLAYFTLPAATFFDAAEVFIFISGFTTALVYGRRLAAKGALYMTAQVFRRAWQLYVAHVFLFVMFIAEVSYTVMTFNNPMYNEEMRVADFLGRRRHSPPACRRACGGSAWHSERRRPLPARQPTRRRSPRRVEPGARCH